MFFSCLFALILVCPCRVGAAKGRPGTRQGACARRGRAAVAPRRRRDGQSADRGRVARILARTKEWRRRQCKWRPRQEEEMRAGDYFSDRDRWSLPRQCCDFEVRLVSVLGVFVRTVFCSIINSAHCISCSYTLVCATSACVMKIHGRIHTGRYFIPRNHVCAVRPLYFRRADFCHAWRCRHLRR